MKVKFLKAGGWAPEKIGAAQFDFEIGDEKSGISENDVADMKKAGIAELIGPDDIEDEADTTVEAPALEEDGANEKPKSEDDTSSEVGASGESVPNGNEKPWNNNKK